MQEYYAEALRQHGFSHDPAQLEAVKLLERVRTDLIDNPPRRNWLIKLKQKLRLGARKREPVTGAYLWGGVGRGKTFIMDIFFDALPFEDKRRYHFHRLMYRVHTQLKLLKGAPDPIAIIADDLAGKVRVICFDEFFVSDIGDAMILGRLLNALFERGVSFVATSNIPPEDLYKGGLQRQNFLPAIELLKTHTQVLNVDAGNDYRLRVLEQAEIWHSPLDEVAEQNLLRYFAAIAPDKGNENQEIEILGRDIPTRKRADAIAWFEFAAVCDGPRSQDDYIELARTFQTVLLSNVPQLDGEKEDQARRFVALVDEFYERRVKLIVSATHPITELYTGNRLQLEFQRTCSRLIEMQSLNYLAQAHIP
jgi:cell division protein ZapE